ncbi:MAG: DNA modification methylase, partial [Thermotogota bacterium]|nr:DNA modification methylase [Thermotogota bacterium]
NKILRLKSIQETVGNPNVMDDEVFDGLVSSMRKKGWYFEPTTVWEYEPEKYRAISGHKRIRAGIKAGILETVFNVICDPTCTEEQARLDLMEANHRHGHDDDELSKLFIESMIDDLDVDIDIIVESTGLSDAEIEELLNFGEIEDSEKDEELPNVRTTDIKLGDMFQLGEHRVLCGDSTKVKDVEKLMNGVKADMVFTDPPYGVSYADKNKFLNSIDKGNCIQTEITSDHGNAKDMAKLWGAVFQNISKIILKDCSSYYICSPQGGDLYLMMMMMMIENGLPLRHNIIWAKNNHVFGRCDYNYKHESILYGWNIKHKFFGYGDQKFSVWNYNKPLKNDLHPTMKPVELIVNAILNSSQRNMIVCDPFLGSGSTLIACEKTNRKCYGMEIDSIYVQVIIDRWEKFADKKAIKLN